MGNNFDEIRSFEYGPRDCLSCTDDGYEMREYYCSRGKHCIKENKMEDDWDFGFTSEEEIKELTSTEVNSKLVEMKNMIMPLLENLKKNPDKDVIKWEGKQRVKQIDAFIKKLENFTKG